MPSDLVLANFDVAAGHEPQLSGPLVLAIPPMTKLLVQVERPQAARTYDLDQRRASATIGRLDGPRRRQHSRTAIMPGAVAFREQVPSKFADIATGLRV